MRSLIFGVALLAIASPALAQDYRNYGGYDRDSYSNGYSRDYDRDGDYDRRDRALASRDYDRDGDIDSRDRYLAVRDIDRDGDYDRRDRYLGRDRDYRGGYGWSVGRAVPAHQNVTGSWIVNPHRFGLPRAPRYTHWVRARSDALLVRNRDRVILRVVRDVL